MPKTIVPRPAADNSVPTGSSLVPGMGGESAMRLLRTRMPSTITTSPAKTHRQLA